MSYGIQDQKNDFYNRDDTLIAHGQGCAIVDEAEDTRHKCRCHKKCELQV